VTQFKQALVELAARRRLTLANVPDGFDAFVAADFARLMAGEAHGRAAVLVHVARDSQRARAFQEAFTFAAPDLEMLDFPEWDCQPYDRVSPNAAIAARRVTVLARLARSQSSEERPRVISTTVAALLQRVSPLKWISAESFSAAPGNAVNMDELIRWLENNGFLRASSVRETGEYAVRGGILDLQAPGMAAPVRLDFFGDTLDLGQDRIVGGPIANGPSRQNSG